MFLPLQSSLQCPEPPQHFAQPFKAIWVDASHRCRNPNEDLPKDFHEKKDEHYESLDSLLVSRKFTEKSKSTLTDKSKLLNANMLDNKLEKVGSLGRRRQYINA